MQYLRGHLLSPYRDQLPFFIISSSISISRGLSTTPPPPSSKPSSASGDDEWNDAWETAWLPEDLSGKNRAPWETDVNFLLPSSSPSSAPPIVLSSDVDPDTKAFVEEMDERWDERRAAKKIQGSSAEQVEGKKKGSGVDDYRVKKQRIHAGLWMKEIEKLEESRLGNSGSGANTDIDRLLDSCSEIFDSGKIELNDSKVPSTSEFKTKPNGWESTSNTQDGNIWDVTQREEDLLLQEFERRIAFSKFQIASFIKSHIFSRRRPIDGWKYMIEELGPNARKGKGSVQRLPTLADPSTQPYKEDKPAIASKMTPSRRR